MHCERPALQRYSANHFAEGGRQTPSQRRDTSAGRRWRRRRHGVDEGLDHRAEGPGPLWSRHGLLPDYLLEAVFKNQLGMIVLYLEILNGSILKGSPGDEPNNFAA